MQELIVVRAIIMFFLIAIKLDMLPSYKQNHLTYKWSIFIVQMYFKFYLEEPAGFEPANQGVADPRLTTWLRFHKQTHSLCYVLYFTIESVICQTHNSLFHNILCIKENFRIHF